MLINSSVTEVNVRQPGYTIHTTIETRTLVHEIKLMILTRNSNISNILRKVIESRIIHKNI